MIGKTIEKNNILYAKKEKKMFPAYVQNITQIVKNKLFF